MACARRARSRQARPPCGHATNHDWQDPSNGWRDRRCAFVLGTPRVPFQLFAVFLNEGTRSQRSIDKDGTMRLFLSVIVSAAALSLAITDCGGRIDPSRAREDVGGTSAPLIGGDSAPVGFTE